MVRFLHSADWQLGMTRRFLSKEAQARFSQARCDVIRTIGRIASEECCQFVVVAGDIFESNQVDRQTVSRAMAALQEVKVPVFLLPGNHDPLDAATVYRSTTFLARRPENVHVLENAQPIPIGQGVEVVGAPWTSKRPLEDLVAAVTRGLEVVPGVLRVVVGHGAVDLLSPDTGDPALIVLAAAEVALAVGHVHYLALGDRHSATRIGDSGRVWYSGSPEPTDYDEVNSGCVLVVELDHKACSVKEVRTGTWRFVEEADVPLTSREDVESLRARLDVLPDKQRTALKLRLRGALPLRVDAQLRQVIDEARDLLAALEVREDAYVIAPEDGDFDVLGLTGFAKAALDDLRAKAGGGSLESASAREALALLVRLAARPG